MESVQQNPKLKELEQKIEELKDEVDRLARECKYSEADVKQNELKAAQKRYKELHDELILTEQDNEINDFDEAYNFLVEQFNALWDKEMEQFHQDAEKQKLALQV